MNTTASSPNTTTCPICRGRGFVRRPADPSEHGKLSRLEPCVCRMRSMQAVARERLYARSGLPGLSNATFDNFVPSGRPGISPAAAESLASAYDAARVYSDRPDGWLVLAGSYGCGKTHLAAAIANVAVSRGTETYFETVPDMLDVIRQAARDESEGFDLEQVRTVSLLVLDDFGTENLTAWALEKLFQILNYRYVNRLPTVITTNLALESLDGRIRSRLMDVAISQIVEISAPDYRRGAERQAPDAKTRISALNPRLTFDSFSGVRPVDPKDQTAAAVSAAKKFVKNPSGWLVFVGPSWVGKSHLVMAVCNALRATGQALYFTQPDMLDHLRNAFDEGDAAADGSYARRLNELKNAPILALDDLDLQRGSAWGKERLAQILNHRHAAGLPTLIATSRLTPSADPLERKIVSRLTDKAIASVFYLLTPFVRPERNK